jgi:hypothetical protein
MWNSIQLRQNELSFVLFSKLKWMNVKEMKIELRKPFFLFFLIMQREKCRRGNIKIAWKDEQTSNWKIFLFWGVFGLEKVFAQFNYEKRFNSNLEVKEDALIMFLMRQK